MQCPVNHEVSPSGFWNSTISSPRDCWALLFLSLLVVSSLVTGSFLIYVLINTQLNISWVPSEDLWGSLCSSPLSDGLPRNPGCLMSPQIFNSISSTQGVQKAQTQFPFPRQQPRNCFRTGSWSNCRTYLFFFHFVKDYCPSLPDHQCQVNYYFSYSAFIFLLF